MQKGEVAIYYSSRERQGTLINKSLAISWIHDNYRKYHNVHAAKATDCSTQSALHGKYSCQMIKQSHGDILSEFFFISKAQKTKTSWNEAADLCSEIGGNLPILLNRQQLEQLVAVLKLSPDLPSIEALYIGLQWKNMSEKVCVFCSFFCS